MYGEEPAFDCNNCKFGWEIFEQTKIKKKIFEKIEDFNQCPKSQFEECDKQCHS